MRSNVIGIGQRLKAQTKLNLARVPAPYVCVLPEFPFSCSSASPAKQCLPVARCNAKIATLLSALYGSSCQAVYIPRVPSPNQYPALESDSNGLAISTRVSSSTTIPHTILSYWVG